MRDGLSLLDQAIAHGAGAVGETEVRDMLGLADRERVFELFAAVMKGEIASALDLLGEQYRAGADPIAVLEDMLELTHWLTRVKLVPAVADEPGIAEIERRQGQELTAELAMPELTRAWQMLLKGLSEARSAPHTLMAVEMALVRLAYAADLPSPADALRALDGAPSKSAPPQPPAPPPPAPAEQTSATPPPTAQEPAGESGGGQTALAEERAPEHAAPEEQQPEARTGGAPGADITCLEDIVALAGQHREVDLRHWLVSDVHLVRFSPGHIELRQNEIVLRRWSASSAKNCRPGPVGAGWWRCRRSRVSRRWRSGRRRRLRPNCVPLRTIRWSARY